jgi:hypothetical protein
VRFVGDTSPFSVEHLRVMAAGQFAYILEVLGIAKGDDTAATARSVRDYLIVLRPPGGHRFPWPPPQEPPTD